MSRSESFGDQGKDTPSRGLRAAGERERRVSTRGKQADPRSADGRGELPAQNLPSPAGANAVDRVVMRLACGHDLLCDELDWLEEGNTPPSQYCRARGCGDYERVERISVFRDEDLSR
jgi:hypothetical protein